MRYYVIYQIVTRPDGTRSLHPRDWAMSLGEANAILSGWRCPGLGVVHGTDHLPF